MASLYLTVEANLKKVQEFREEISKLTDELENMDESSDTEKVGELETQLSKAKAGMQDAARAASEAAGDLAELSSIIKELSDIEEASDNLSESLDPAQAEEVKKHVADLNERLAELLEKTNDVADSADKESEGLKRVAEATDDGTKKTSVFSSILGKLGVNSGAVSEAMKSLPAPMQSSIQGIMGMVSASKAFLATGLGLILGGIALALQSVNMWFHSTQEGQEAFTRGSAYLSGILGQLKEIAINIGRALYKAFTDPKQAASDLWDFIKENFVNRFKAVGNIAASIGKAISSAFKGNFSEAKEALGGIADELLTVATGVDDVTGKVKDFIDKTNEAAEATAKLATRERNLANERSKWQVKEAELDSKIAEARNRMSTAESSVEKEASLKVAQDLIAKKYEQRLKFAREEYAIIKARNAITSSNDQDVDAENKALAEVRRVEQERQGEMRLFERQAASLRDERQKAALVAEQTLSDVMLANRKADIEAMKDEYAKRRELIQLEYEAEIRAAEEQAEKLAQINVETGVSGVNDDGLTDSQAEAIAQAKKGAEMKKAQALADEAKARQEALAESIRQYGNYEERREQMAKDYAEKIAQAEAEGDAHKVVGLQRQQKKDESALKMEELKGNADISQAFTDLSFVSTEALDKLVEQFATLAPTMAETLDPTDLREFMTTMEALETEMAERNPVQSLRDGLDELREAQTQLSEAQLRVKDANDKLAKAQKGTYANDAAKVKAVAAAEDELAAARANASAQEKAVQKANKKIAASYEQCKAVTKTVVEGINSIGEAADGQAKEVFNLIGNISDMAITSMEAVSKVAEGTAEAMSAAEKASVILLIIQAAVKVLMVMKDLLSRKEDNYDDLKSKYEALSSLWDDLISKKEQYVDIKYGDEAQKAGEEIKALAEQQMTLQKSLAQTALSDGKSKTSHSIGYRMNKRLSDNEYFNKAMYDQLDASGYSYVKGHVEKLMNMDAETLAKFKEQNAAYWAALDGNYREALDNYLSYGEKITETEESMSTAAVGQTFDEFVSNWQSALSDMDTSADDFIDDFTKSLGQSVLQSMLASEFNDELDGIYKRMAKTLRNNTLTEAQKAAELNAAKAELAEVSARAEESRNAWAEALDLKPSEQEQDASKGAFQTMSQDTANELNGRFTALQISGEQLVAHSANIENIAASVQDIMAQSYLELAQIRDNTGAIVLPIQTMQEDIRKMQRKLAEL